MDQPGSHSGDDLSFEALTFGDNNSDENDAQKKDKKSSKKPVMKKERSATSLSLDMDRNSVFASFEDENVNVNSLLQKMETFGVVSAYYFKDKQNYGFIHFAESSAAEAAVHYFKNSDFEGADISVEHASKIGRGEPKSANGASSSFSNTVGSPQGPPVIEKPDTILVLKNLPFHLKQEQLHEILMSISTTTPQSINLHFDNLGVFRGMAFVKYHRLDDAIHVYEGLNGYDVGGRKVRVEYKRKPSTKVGDVPPEWQDEEDLRKLWDQVRDFKDNTLQNDLALPIDLTNAQRKAVHAMAEKLKIVHFSTGDGDARCLNLSKKAPPQNNNHGSHRGTDDANGKARAIEIKGRRRGDSDAKQGSSPTEGSSFGRSRYGSSGGGSFGAHKFSGSVPDMESGSWRRETSIVSPRRDVISPAPGSSFSNGTPGTTPGGSMSLIQPSRQPKGPDGSCGFGDMYKTHRKPGSALSPLGSPVAVLASGGVS